MCRCVKLCVVTINFTDTSICFEKVGVAYNFDTCAVFQHEANILQSLGSLQQQLIDRCGYISEPLNGGF